ncbi:MAG TPA: hypothetical protein VHY91_04860 [Pirellulales bacterium]|jgi:hypothetical protein|nr:hypothetical protein [Pirellulales bacterium]
MFPFGAVPVDVVPSTFQVVALPLFEGIVVGLALGYAMLFVMSTVERLIAWWTGAPAADTLPAAAPPAARRPAPRPALGARTLPTRPRRPAGSRPTLLAKMT